MLVYVAFFYTTLCRLFHMIRTINSRDIDAGTFSIVIAHDLFLLILSRLLNNVLCSTYIGPILAEIWSFWHCHCAWLFSFMIFYVAFSTQYSLYCLSWTNGNKDIYLVVLTLSLRMIFLFNVILCDVFFKTPFSAFRIGLVATKMIINFYCLCAEFFFINLIYVMSTL